jgi:predicted metal-dependent HD superfamily phosphohydrolase
LAIWFHDAVYETEKSGNEQRSAEWARAVIETSSLGVESAERVYRLILATCHDAEVADLDGQIVVDVDLSILGREEEVFWHYEQNIRKEYAWVPESVFRQKRADILRSFLARPRIFNLDLYRMQFEERARLNLERAILRLDQPVEVA